MGYYTEFHFKAKIRPDTPRDVIRLLDSIINTNKGSVPAIDHNFFKLERWYQTLNGKQGTDWEDKFYKKGDCFVLIINSSINYGGEEIYAFIDWISPYVVGRKMKQYLGWSKGENWESPRINHYVERPLSKHNPKK